MTKETAELIRQANIARQAVRVERAKCDLRLEEIELELEKLRNKAKREEEESQTQP